MSEPLHIQQHEQFLDLADTKQDLAFAVYGPEGSAFQVETIAGIKHSIEYSLGGRIKYPTIGHKLMANMLVSEPGSSEFYPESKPAGTVWVIVPHDKVAEAEQNIGSEKSDNAVFQQGAIITSVPVKTEWGEGYLAADKDGLFLIRQANGITKDQLDLFVNGALDLKGKNWQTSLFTSARNNIMPRNWHPSQVSVIAIPNAVEDHLVDQIDNAINSIGEQLKLFGMGDPTKA